MLVRMIKTRPAVIDGAMERAFAGHEYNLPKELAETYIAEGSAYEVTPELKKDMKAGKLVRRKRKDERS
jgi:hypothetical protein